MCESMKVCRPLTFLIFKALDCPGEGCWPSFVVSEGPMLEKGFHAAGCHCCSVILPDFTLMAICIVADGLDDDSRNLIPYSSSLHFEPDDTVFVCDAISVDTGFHDHVPGCKQAEVNQKTGAILVLEVTPL